MMRHLLCGAAALLIAGCAHNRIEGPRPLPVLEVGIPVTGGCVPTDMSAPPEYPDTDEALRAAPDAAARYQLMYGGRKLRIARANEVEPVIATCPRKGAGK